MAKLPFSETEFDLLKTHFGVEGKQGFIRWRDLCALIEEREEKLPRERLPAVEPPQ